MHENTIIKCFTTQIDRLETKLNIQAQENRELRQEVFELKKNVEFQSSLFDELKKNGEKLAVEKLKEREDNEDKLAMIEDRSRRDNLRFGGIPEEVGETWAQSEHKVKTFIREKLGLEGPIDFHRAHRTGRKPENGDRVIVAKFKDFHDRERVLNKYIEAKLWENQLYVNEDYSIRTVNKRKELFKQVKELRANGKHYKVVYNRLVQKNRTEEAQKLEAEILNELNVSSS